MTETNWWENFYDNSLGDSTLTTNTEPVYKFISELIPQNKQLTIFDQCCGKGHLTYEFAKHGHISLGIDMSKSCIDFAKENFLSDTCKFIQTDAKKYVSDKPFDVVINWNTSFGYDENDEENFKILEAFASNLKPGGKFIISTLNPKFIKLHFEKFLDRSFMLNGDVVNYVKESFIEGNMLKSYWHMEFSDGRKAKKFGQTKMYSIDELNDILLKYNLFIENVFGNIYYDKLSDNSGSMIIYGSKYDIR